MKTTIDVITLTKTWLNNVNMIVREKSSKNEMNPSKKNKPERFSHFWNPRDLYITFLRDNIKERWWHFSN